jgi:hypothetical protein
LALVGVTVVAIVAGSIVAVHELQRGPAPRATVVPSARSRSHFYVVGSDIVAPDGMRFYPIGANVGTSGNFDWRGTAAGHVEDALAWGWNTIRLTVYCSSAYPFTIRKTSGYQALLAAVDGIVTEYTAKHIVVILECQDALVDQNETDQFWHDVALRYRDNAYVWFNPMNEPTWNDNDAWLALQEHYLRLVRSTGAENVFVADVQNGGNDAGWDGAKRVYDARMGRALDDGECNVVFSQHEYGGIDDNIGAASYWERVHDAHLAMIVGEFGYSIDGTSTAGSYAQNLNGANAVFANAPAEGVGVLWWHATHGDGYSLKADGGAFYEGGPSAGLSAAGQRLWDLGHDPPDLGPFTGDLAQSHCPSVR